MKGKRTYKELLGLIILSFFIFHLSYSYASDIMCVGTAAQVVHGRDTVYVFRDEIALRSMHGDVDWQDGHGQIVASNTDEIYPDDGIYRILRNGKPLSGPFRVVKYTPLDNLNFTVETTCDNTILHVTGLDAGARTYSLSYTALAWDGEQWADSTVEQEGTLTPTIVVNTLIAGATVFRLCYDPKERAELGLEPACVEVPVQESELKAVKMMLTSLAIVHGEEGGKTNEKNSPTRQDIITANTSEDYSGPLEVAFYSNPTPAVQFFRWNIYKASERIATRQDKDIRYTFSEPGAYRIACAVNNASCATDSMEMIVNISESYLRVPNVFTPDGNGQNDEFRVSYRSLREFHCWIYNRWGKLVYEFTDPSKGWDGTIGGRPAAEGAYYYVIRALGTDAAKNAGYYGIKATYNKKKLSADQSVIGVYQLSGDINLLRSKQ